VRGRTDGNQKEIICVLRKLGVMVQDLSQVGDGCPDLLLSLLGRTYVAEVKYGLNWKLRATQERWHKRWLAPVVIFESSEQVVEWVNHLRREERSTWHRE